ncbi:MAG: hypothetical protein R3C68_12145 [Myxococcota bacterium]
MPVVLENQEQGGHRDLLERAFVPHLKKRSITGGALAVLYDKNFMETSGYAAVLADITGETVYLVPFYEDSWMNHARFTTDGILETCDAGTWTPIRAALRYVTQRPWNRIPPITKTMMFNPVVVCLAGGRNKMLAAKAYDFYNGEIQPSGLLIRTPETIGDVSRAEIPLWLSRMVALPSSRIPTATLGRAFIQSPTNVSSKPSWMRITVTIVYCSLIGNAGWSSRSQTATSIMSARYSNKKSEIYVFRRTFYGRRAGGFFPVAIYARRARRPLLAELDGTLLGHAGNKISPLGLRWFDTESVRLLMDSRDFKLRLGIGLDDLSQPYIQTVLAVTASRSYGLSAPNQQKVSFAGNF